jgi:Lipid A 3-O-deacylase (PagL)
MFRPATVPVWKALLVLLAVGLPLHAQSASGCWPSLTRTVADGPPAQTMARTCPERAGDPDVGPGEIAGLRRLVFTTFSDELTVKPIATWDGLRPQTADCDMWSSSDRQTSRGEGDQSAIVGLNDVGAASKSPPAAVIRPNSEPHPDLGPYYRNKLEFAFDGGWLPINIPFVFDIFMGDAYNMTPLRYTLVPLVASLRWHIDDVGGPWIFRGNWDMTASGSITLIPRGPETHYFSYDMGVRRNFVPHRGKIAPYLDGRLGLGEIDAKEPLGVQFAQGQNFTFTVNLGAGARYNFNPRYSISAGLNWMHISNLYISEPAFSNYGINVYGPMFGIDVRLGKPRHGSR